MVEFLDSLRSHLPYVLRAGRQLSSYVQEIDRLVKRAIVDRGHDAGPAQDLTITASLSSGLPSLAGPGMEYATDPGWIENMLWYDDWTFMLLPHDSIESAQHNSPYGN